MAIWVILSVLILLVLLGVVAVAFAKKGKKKSTDYYAFYVMGITWLPFGIILMVTTEGSVGNFFFILGLVYLAIGLAHKDEWKKNHRTWKQLKKEERRLRVIAFIVLGLLLLVGIVVFYIVKFGIGG
jgi:uncharacterized membrane protein